MSDPDLKRRFEAELARTRPDADPRLARLGAFARAADVPPKNPCPHCDFKYASRAALARHLEQDHREQLDAECTWCGKPFASVGSVAVCTPCLKAELEARR